MPGVSLGLGLGAIGAAVGQTFGSGGNFCDLYATVFTPLSSPDAVRDVACGTQGYLRGEANGYKYSYTAVPFKNRIKQHAVTLELNYDLGAFEYSSGGLSNLPPVANAGFDKCPQRGVVGDDVIDINGFYAQFFDTRIVFFCRGCCY